MNQLQEEQDLASLPLPPISLEQLRRFADAAQDPNPIHQDAAVAQANGLPGVIAHGMLIAGYLGEYAREQQVSRLGAGYRIARFQVRFKGMTLLGESLSLRGTLKPPGEEGRALMQLEAWGANQELKATATVNLWKK